MKKLTGSSYAAGFYDTEKGLGKKPHFKPDIDFTYPDEDAGQLDTIAYIRGCIRAIEKHLNEQK